jgi:integrase
VSLLKLEHYRLLTQLDGTMWLIVAVLYGTDVRLEECLELRVKDLDFDRNHVTVRRGGTEGSGDDAYRHPNVSGQAISPRRFIGISFRASR